MGKDDLAWIFNQIGLLLELKGENPFKVRAYYNAARTLENIGEDLALLIHEDRLGEVVGFGDAIVKKIKEWDSTGRIEFYEKLKTTTPSGLIEFLRIPGLGPRKIRQIYDALGITSFSELEQACQKNKLSALPGFGAKTQEKISAGIKFISEHCEEYLLAEALTTAFIWRFAILSG